MKRHGIEKLMGDYSYEVELKTSHYLELLRQAKKEKVPFKLSLDQAWDVFVQQCGQCRFTYVRLEFGKTAAESTAYLDRIDPAKGYVPGNVRWLHTNMARMKADLSDHDFYQWAKRLMKVARSTGFPPHRVAA